MPYLGLGTYQSENRNEVVHAVKTALDVGYRHIDTASVYENEYGIGKAIKQSSVPREDLFVTSKVWNTEQGHDSTIESFHNSLDRLQLDYLDLYLIHWPVKGKYKETWKALEYLYAHKKVRAIGVSNFSSTSFGTPYGWFKNSTYGKSNGIPSLPGSAKFD